MRCQVLCFAGGNIDSINISVGEWRIHSHGVEGLVVTTPCERSPGEAGLFLIREPVHLVRGPIEKGDVVAGSVLWLVVEGDGPSVMRPARALFPNIGRAGEVYDFTTITRDGEK